MTTSILIMAHAPLAHALRECALHVVPDCAQGVLALDVPPQAEPEQTLQAARQCLQQAGVQDVLVLTDVFGATPCNTAQRLVDGVHSRLVAGVNLPMLLRTVCYCHEPLAALVERALAGGTQGVMQVGSNAPQNQGQRNHDQNHRHHQQ